MQPECRMQIVPFAQTDNPEKMQGKTCAAGCSFPGFVNSVVMLV